MSASSQAEFEVPQQATREIIRELHRAPDAFAKLFAAQDEDVLHLRTDGEWSAVEVVCHLADHDAFVRSRRFEAVLSERNPELPNDETRFEVARSSFQKRSAVEALDFFSQERSLTVAALESLTPEDWRRTGIYPNGEERTLLQLADLRSHDHEHFEQAAAAIANANQKRR